jgi:hypothetical protein
METTHVYVMLPNKSGYCAGWNGIHKSRNTVAEVRIEVWGAPEYIRPNSYQVCQNCLSDILDTVRKDRTRRFIIKDLRFPQALNRIRKW